MECPNQLGMTLSGLDKSGGLDELQRLAGDSLPRPLDCRRCPLQRYGERVEKKWTTLKDFMDMNDMNDMYDMNDMDMCKKKKHFCRVPLINFKGISFV